jgi:5-methylthioadenosine/S-adenosylhomocysteine deaminase
VSEKALSSEATMKNSEYDILVTGGILLTMSGVGEDIMENPVIGIRNGSIALIEKRKAGGDHSYKAKEILDVSGSLIMPGLINTHTHLPMVCFRGMADDLHLMDWLQNHIWPAEAKYVNRDMVYAGSMLAMAEMILSGTTTFCDAYFYESSVAGATVASGMRGIVCQGFIDLPNRNDPGKITEVAERFIDRWLGKYPLIIPALACHAPYTCFPETLSCIKNVARQADVPYNIHVSETRDEVSIIRERYGKSTVAHLRDINVLDRRTIAVHCNWLEEDEMDILRDHDVKISHNPESSLKLAAGIAAIPTLLKKGVAVGLGTDGAASNNDLDLFGEMRTAAIIHKMADMDPTVMDAMTVLKMATIEGARVLGLEDRIGSIEVGKCADMIILDINKPHWVPLFSAASQLIYAASGADVTTSIIGGKVVMRDRKLLTMDLTAVVQEINKIAENIRKGSSDQSKII